MIRAASWGLVAVLIAACGGSGGADGGPGFGGNGGGSGGGTGGPSFTLLGEGSFTPVAANASRPETPDGGRRADEISLVLHDYAPGAGCSGTIPGTADASVLTLRCVSGDGGAATVGSYRIISSAEPFEGQVCTLATRGGAASSGMAAISQLTPTRYAGSFNSTLTLDDGGSGPLNGSWDVPVCP